jgi:serine/threonine protein kinase
MNTDLDISDSGFVDPDSVSFEWSDITLMQARAHSVLYRAKRYGRWFVLKTLPVEQQSLTDCRLVQEREFSLGVQLVHPNIVATYSLEEVEGIGRCLVLEAVDGVTLVQWLSAHSCKHARQRAVEQLLDAVEYLHGHQLVHRDLKPSNILITHNGNNLKLIDFGLSSTDDIVAATPNDIQDDLVRLADLLALFDLPAQRTVIARCKQHQYANICALRRAMERHLCLRHRIPIVALVAAMAVALCVMGWKMRQQLTTERQAQERQEAMLADVNSVCDVESERLLTIADAEKYSEFATAKFFLNSRFAILRDSLGKVYPPEDAVLNSLCFSTFDNRFNALQMQFAEHVKSFPSMYEAYKNGEIFPAEYARLSKEFSDLYER